MSVVGSRPVSFAGNGSTVRQSQGYVVIGLEGIAGRDHGTRLPDEAAGHEPAVRSNADDAVGRIPDQLAQAGGQGEQSICLFGHGGAPTFLMIARIVSHLGAPSNCPDG